MDNLLFGAPLILFLKSSGNEPIVFTIRFIPLLTDKTIETLEQIEIERVKVTKKLVSM